MLPRPPGKARRCMLRGLYPDSRLGQFCMYRAVMCMMEHVCHVGACCGKEKLAYGDEACHAGNSSLLGVSFFKLTTGWMRSWPACVPTLAPDIYDKHPSPSSSCKTQT